VGERFAVRNSGALAVVEGVGDHGCEYMTGGMVVVLGETGQNFGAGMSSGVAYVLDLEQTFRSRANMELVDIERIENDDEWNALYTVVEWHARRTRSRWAEQLLKNWDDVAPSFWRVQPRGTTTTARDFAAPPREQDEKLIRAGY
jgi:glutamate synthase domain-containing protein 3